MATTNTEAKLTWFLSIVAHFSLLPLLFQSNLAIIKISLLLISTLITTIGLQKLRKSEENTPNPEFAPIHQLLYIIGLVGLLLYEFAIQYIIGLDKRLPFLPLLLTSVYCSVGIVYFWFKYYAIFLCGNFEKIRSKNAHFSTKQKQTKKHKVK